QRSSLSKQACTICRHWGFRGFDGCLGLGRCAPEPGLRVLVGQEQSRAPLRIDALGQLIGERGDKAENLDIDVGSTPFDRSLPFPIKTGKGKEGAWVLTFESEPMPAGGRVAVGFAKGGGGDQTSARLEAVLPKFRGELVVARIGHALGRVTLPQQYEAPAA